MHSKTLTDARRTQGAGGRELRVYSSAQDGLVGYAHIVLRRLAVSEWLRLSAVGVNEQVTCIEARHSGIVWLTPARTRMAMQHESVTVGLRKIHFGGWQTAPPEEFVTEDLDLIELAQEFQLSLPPHLLSPVLAGRR